MNRTLKIPLITRTRARFVSFRPIIDLFANLMQLDSRHLTVTWRQIGEQGEEATDIRVCEKPTLTQFPYSGGIYWREFFRGDSCIFPNVYDET